MPESDNYFIVQCIFIADGLQRLAALGVLLARRTPGLFARAFELQSERPVELND